MYSKEQKCKWKNNDIKAYFLPKKEIHAVTTDEDINLLKLRCYFECVNFLKFLRGTFSKKSYDVNF